MISPIAKDLLAQDLPIQAVLPDLLASLARNPRAVLVAPPGAGKTTGVPLALLNAPWRQGGTILVLEPRRIAARGAASRMASLLGEPLGATLGLRARFDNRSSDKTRILVVTEGVFTRMILDDPMLDGIAAVLFDEFHERSLDADLGLALALETQTALRPDLRLVVMSATLDDQRIAQLMGDAPVLISEGRAFSVETRYRGRDPNARIEDQMTGAIRHALSTESGSILAFLPGQGEIERVKERLEAGALPTNVILCPLYGALEPAQQDAAIRPSDPGQRKIVLATSIAETSITIDGVRIVVDSGQARVARFEPDLGLTHLDTIRVSRASADQRRGRAGRTEPGICYRLWDEAQDQSLLPFNRPEILESDLAGFVLDCAQWGAADPAALPLLDAPPAAALKEARNLLVSLHALDMDGRITPNGRALRALPLAPRLAALVLEGARRAQADDAALIGVLVSERGLGGAGSDLDHRLDRLKSDRGPRAQQAKGMARNWAKLAQSEVERLDLRLPKSDPLSVGSLLALAFCDRIGKSRGDGAFSLVNGRVAALDAADSLAASPFLAIADLTGSAARSRIVLAARITVIEIHALFGERISDDVVTMFDKNAKALRARRVRRLNGLIFDSSTLPVPATAENAALLANGIATLGLKALPFSKALAQWRDRVMFLQAAEPNGEWPDLSEPSLLAQIRDWLAPYLSGKTSLTDLGADELANALHALLPYGLKARLEAEAPTHFVAPTGNAHPIDYESEGAPLLTIRVQELFGLKAHPMIARGRLKLTLELTSPAHRPIQITRDLPGFWAGSWGDVKAEMRGRYPKHPWPDDPANATPTARAKPRGT